jgi:septal ring factor EnvC (AmiA/AmiB activator)
MMHSGLRVAAILVIFVPMVSRADSYDALLQRYEREISSQESQVNSLKASLAEKQRSAKHWEEQATAARERWKAAGDAMHQTQKILDRVREKWRRAHGMAEAADWSAHERTRFATAANHQISLLVDELYRNRVVPGTDAVGRGVIPEGAGEVLMARTVSALLNLSRSATGQAHEALEQERALRQEESRWQGEQKSRRHELDQAQAEQESHWKRFKEAERRQRHLEEEKVQLEQSEKALRVMLKELYAHRDQTAAAKQQYLAERKGFSALRGKLPWPVDGKVVQTFGKQYSKDLQQLVVSNGIKIQGQAVQPVRAVQSGKVLFADAFRQYGRLVIVEHHGGLTSIYGGLGKTEVKEGQQLIALQKIGETDAGGSFYFELRRDEEPIDPAVWLTLKPQ